MNIFAPICDTITSMYVYRHYVIIHYYKYCRPRCTIGYIISQCNVESVGTRRILIDGPGVGIPISEPGARRLDPT